LLSFIVVGGNKVALEIGPLELDVLPLEVVKLKVIADELIIGVFLAELSVGGIFEVYVAGVYPIIIELDDDLPDGIVGGTGRFSDVMIVELLVEDTPVENGTSEDVFIELSTGVLIEMAVTLVVNEESELVIEGVVK